ncbi:MAG: glycosyltransferase, partial [Candidatus Omnitrophica bacterium]|nr:glycosyltransferase [Candidatus Omnitrophota bacterium]
MRILHLISSAGMYGAERMLLSLVSEHRKSKECHVQIAAFKNSGNPHLELAEAAEKEGIDTTVFFCRGQLDFSAIGKLKHCIRKNRIDLIHSHGYKADFYAFFATFRMDIKRVATCHTWYSTSRKMFMYEMLDKKILRRFDAVAAVSRELRCDILKSGLDEHKVQMICNGIDMERFQQPVDTSVFKTEFNLQDKT